MSHLVGPHPFDPEAPGRGARVLLNRFATDAENLPTGNGSLPGLYLIIDDDGALRGFWVTLGESWLDEGGAGGVSPPFAKALFDAATEELWWIRFRVAPKVLEAWRPVVVLEWTPQLAERSSLPPPGRPAEIVREAAKGQRWLQADDLVAAPAASGTAGRRSQWGHLPDGRSLLCLIRGSLRWTRAVHEGRFELVHMAGPDEEGMGIASMPAHWKRDGLPLDEWLDMAAGQATPPDGEHRLGHPLRLPGDRVGFPMTGWLSRDLEIHPPRPADAATGILVSRDTRNPIIAQTAMAVSVTIAVLLGTLAFSEGLQWIARPVVEGAAPAIEPAAQPAFSVCSADHGRFVDSLACQVQALAGDADVGTADCTSPTHDVDLQAAWCGLRDRDMDGAVTASGHSWADAAASQACFEVLGRPWEYTLGGLGDTVANPSKLLTDGRLRVNALVELVADLDAACENYREKAFSIVDGAILAAHIGGETGESSRLQDLAFDRVARGQSEGVKACHRAGRDGLANDATTWEGLCGADATDQQWDTHVPWHALSGPPPADTPSVIARYAAARYARTPAPDGRWACYARLSRGLGEGVSPGLWDLSVPIPTSFTRGGVTTQIALDSWMLSARSGSPPEDVCWREVDRLLAPYEPAHPLVGPPKEGGWPSEEQQVCGQVCAAAFRLQRSSAEAWVTPGSDLALCLDPSAPGSPERGGPDERFDTLSLPWNGGRDGSWVRPSPEDLCAFHMIAQGQVPEVLSKEVPATRWAGQPITGSRLAGGPNGAAVLAAEALITYGRSRSAAVCSRVAAQCFLRELLAVTGDELLGPESWAEAWELRVDDLALRSVAELDVVPWCRIIRPYFSTTGRLPEGELDFPCALGVSEARTGVGAYLDSVVASSFAEATP